MSDLLPGLLANLDAESDQLAAVVDDLVAAHGDDGWTAATPAEGWTVATTVAHLAWTDRAAAAAAASVTRPEAKQAWDDIVTAAFEDPTGFVDRSAHDLASRRRDEVLATWAEGRRDLRAALVGVPAGERLPWFGPPMSPASMATARFMETWAHAQDVYDTAYAGADPLLDGDRPAPTDRLRHVAHLGVRTRDFAFTVHGETPPARAFRVELTAPSGETWTWGPPEADEAVLGSALDFCLLVTQRVHRADANLASIGEDAHHWLDIAQAFAGPPGPGRERRG